MAELITGRGGTDHVDSEDFGAFNAVTLGGGTYILSGCSMVMKTATTLHIAAGELLMQGRHVRIKGAGEDVNVAVGTTGYNRNDIVALHYKQEGGIESVSVEVVAGTPTTGAASDPELGGGSILNGDSEAYAAIARVPIAGLAPSEPVVLVGGLKSNSQLAESISALGDSVYPVGSIYMSTVATNPRTLLGFGTWEQIKDRFLLAAGSTYKAGATGGEATHKLTVSEIPGHRHRMRIGWGDDNGKFNTLDAATGKGSSWGSAGDFHYDGGKLFSADGKTLVDGDKAHNNMPPYLAVYVWKRTA